MKERLRSGVILLLTAAAVAAVVHILLSGPSLERTQPPIQCALGEDAAEWRRVEGEESRAVPGTLRYVRTGGRTELELQAIPHLPLHYVYNPLLESRFLPRGHVPLDAGMHYYLSSRGRILGNVSGRAPLDAQIEIRERPAADFPGIWDADSRVHLSAIITPNGDAGIATQRVARSMYLEPLSVRRFWRGLLGKVAVPDTRCVLVHLSMPAGATTRAAAVRSLEKDWADLRRDYHPAFPGKD